MVHCGCNIWLDSNLDDSVRYQPRYPCGEVETVVEMSQHHWNQYPDVPYTPSKRMQASEFNILLSYGRPLPDLVTALSWDETYDVLEEHPPNMACARCTGPDHGPFFLIGQAQRSSAYSAVNEQYALYAAMKDGVLY